MANPRVPSSRTGAADGAGNGSTLTSNHVDLVRELMRQTGRQDGDGSHQTEPDGQRREPGTGQRAVARDGDGAPQALEPDRHCPRCRLAVAGDGRRFARSDCPRCGTRLESRPASLFRSALPARFRADASGRRDGASAIASRGH